MAMTARETRAFRRAIGSRKHANIVIAIIDSGSATAVADETEKVLKIALGNPSLGANLVAALETGSAVSAETRRALANAIGRQSLADSITTQINAIT